jgi:hypothetical protein
MKLLIDNRLGFYFIVFVSLTTYIDLEKSRNSSRLRLSLASSLTVSAFVFSRYLETEPLSGNIEIFFHFLRIGEGSEKIFYWCIVQSTATCTKFFAIKRSRKLKSSYSLLNKCNPFFRHKVVLF